MMDWPTVGMTRRPPRRLPIQRLRTPVNRRGRPVRWGPSRAILSLFPVPGILRRLSTSKNNSSRKPRVPLEWHFASGREAGPGPVLDGFLACAGTQREITPARLGRPGRPAPSTRSLTRTASADGHPDRRHRNDISPLIPLVEAIRPIRAATLYESFPGMWNSAVYDDYAGRYVRVAVGQRP